MESTYLIVSTTNPQPRCPVSDIANVIVAAIRMHYCTLPGQK